MHLPPQSRSAAAVADLEAVASLPADLVGKGILQEEVHSPREGSQHHVVGSQYLVVGSQYLVEGSQYLVEGNLGSVDHMGSFQDIQDL